MTGACNVSSVRVYREWWRRLWPIVATGTGIITATAAGWSGVPTPTQAGMALAAAMFTVLAMVGQYDFQKRL
jgi:hypothetical protein